MKLKLYRSNHPSTETPYVMSSERDSLPFDIERDKWDLVNDLRESDVVPIGQIYMPQDWEKQGHFLKELGCTRKQLLLIMNIFDDCDTYDWLHWYIEYSTYMHEKFDFRTVMLQNGKRNWNDTSNQYWKIHYDFMFNREKAYMTETDKFETKNKTYFYFDSKGNFRLNPIQKSVPLEQRKIGLCPNRIMKLNARSGLRRTLKTYIKDKSVILGDPSSGIVLAPEDPDMLELLMNTDNNGGGLWMPIANKYYEQTYISIFIETCTVTYPPYNNVRNPFQTITEKTFDPLIKGHFILPFGYAGITKDIKNYGFKFPSWINYEYDEIECDRHRFAAFLEEADRLLNLHINVVESHYVKDFNMLIHNRQVFWSRPYIPLYDQVLDRFYKII